MRRTGIVAQEMETAPTSFPRVTGRQMQMVLDVSRALAVPTDLDRLLCQIAEISCGLLGCERASIFLHDPAKDELWTKVALKSGEIRLPAGQGIVGHAFTNNQVVCVHDPYQDERFYPTADLQSGFVTRNLLSAPMKGLDGKPIGAIECVNKVGVPFGDADLALIELLAGQAGVAVQRHHLQVEAVRAAALQREMDLARRAQEKLIPKATPPVKGLEAVGWTLPASATGGDCFDLWQLPDGRLGVLLADASGHGLAPAMIIGQARALIRAMSDLNLPPNVVLDRANARLCEDLESNQFVTAFLGFVSPDGLVQWASAGQGPILFRASPAGPLAAIDAPRPPLGIVRERGEPAPDPMRLEAGGSLVLLSDALFEATNPAGELFDTERMLQALERLKNDPPADVVGGLRDAIRQWQGGREPLDDETIVIVRRGVPGRSD